VNGPGFNLVRVERLELPRLAAPEPKSGVSTNFTIPALRAANQRSREATLNAVALYHPIGGDQRKNRFIHQWILPDRVRDPSPFAARLSVQRLFIERFPSIISRAI
jgi:hypothetical protein